MTVDLAHGGPNHFAPSQRPEKQSAPDFAFYFILALKDIGHAESYSKCLFNLSLILRFENLMCFRSKKQSMVELSTISQYSHAASETPPLRLQTCSTLSGAFLASD
jgi:hypothetical protein